MFAIEVCRVIIYRHNLNVSKSITIWGNKVKANNNAKKEPLKIDYENKRLSTFYFLPLLLIAGFIPLIVYGKYLYLSGTTQSLYWTGQQKYLDFFSYWKSRWVIALTMIGLVFYIILYVQKKLPFKNLKQYYIPLGIYAIFVVVSTIFAKDTQTALWGFVDMYQGMFVLLSYVIITFLTINFVNNERDVKLFVKAFTFLMIVEGIFGITQYFGFDFFQTALGKKLIVPSDVQVENLSFSFGPKTIYGTLFNPNFVGSFATLMLPLAVAFLLLAKTKKQRILYTVIVVMMIFTCIGSNSRAGYLGVAVSALYVLWLFRKNAIKHWKGIISIFAAFAIFLVGLNVISQGAIFSRLKEFNIKEQIEITRATNENAFKIEDIALGKDSFSITTSREKLNFKIVGDKLYFSDQDDKELRIETKGNKITINDNRYSDYKIIIADNYPGITVERSSRVMNFYFSENGVRLIGTGGKLIEQTVPAESFGPLNGLEKLGSNRGYIWGRTIPLLKNYMFYGAGPDNFPMAFPQDDILTKINVYIDSNIVVDKAHSLYLQIAVNTGVLSLLTLLAIWGYYIFSSFKLYNKVELNSLERYVGAFCSAGILGYLAAGIFNDNVVSVFPIFWIILGMGISINMRIKNKLSDREP